MIKFSGIIFSPAQNNYKWQIFKALDKNSFLNYSQEANVFNKFLNKSGKKRKWHNHEHQMFNPGLPSLGSMSKGPESKKRIAVLNKLFMKHITDLMATGTSAEEIVGLGIEITKVKVGSEYNIVNVYWTCHKEHREDETNIILAKSSSSLRQDLTSLRVIGKVPKINFVRDRSVQSWAAVETLLKTADMGENYVPMGEDLLKNEFGNEKAEHKDATSGTEFSDMPPMRQNVFGVDRLAILNSIVSKMKSRPLKKPDENEIENNLSTHISYTPFNEEAFSQFLLKRKIIKDKLSKNEREAEDYTQTEYNDDDDLEEHDDYCNGDYLEETQDER